MERKPGFCQPFIGFDMEGDAVMLIGVYDDDGERIRYLREEELDLLLGKVEEACMNVFPELYSEEGMAERLENLK